MSHEEIFSELAAAALDAVSVEVATAAREHAAICPECGPELAAMQAAVSMLGEMVPPTQINRGRGAGIRSRLLMRARAERESHSAPIPGPPDIARGVASLTGQGTRVTPLGQRPVTGEMRKITPPAQPTLRVPALPVRGGVSWYAIAATLALIVTGSQLVRVISDRNQIRAELNAPDTTARPVADSLLAVINQKDSMIAAMTGPDVKVVSLASQSAGKPMGRMTWNRASGDWIMVTYNMQPPKPGKTYQVWLVTATSKISAGTFRPDDKGGTMMHARYAMARNALRAVAITEEPDGGMPSPTGPMVAAGGA